MITRVPALEFLGRMLGSYADSEHSYVVTLSRSGYGFVLHGSFCALIGINGEALELHHLLGPNVAIFSAPVAFVQVPKSDEVTFAFTGKHEDFLQCVLAFKGRELTLSFAVNGKVSKEHHLSRSVQLVAQPDVPASGRSAG